jgi:hypothetical protein
MKRILPSSPVSDKVYAPRIKDSPKLVAIEFVSAVIEDDDTQEKEQVQEQDDKAKKQDDQDDEDDDKDRWFRFLDSLTDDPPGATKKRTKFDRCSHGKKRAYNCKICNPCPCGKTIPSLCKSCNVTNKFCHHKKRRVSCKLCKLCK